MQMTNYMTQARQAPAMMLASLAAMGLLMTGCDDGPDCVSGHMVTTVVPVFNGKTTSVVPVTNYVCDEWEKVSPSATP